MPFERNLYIDQRGRLQPKHSRFHDDSCESSLWGHTCDCCGAGCTPGLLANADAGAGVWRFEASPMIQHGMDVRHKRFTWLRKRFPKLMRQLEKAADHDEIYWFYTPREKDSYPWWRVRTLEKCGGLR